LGAARAIGEGECGEQLHVGFASRLAAIVGADHQAHGAPAVEGARERCQRKVGAVVHRDAERGVGLRERGERGAAGEEGVRFGERNAFRAALGLHLGDHAGDGGVVVVGQHDQPDFDSVMGDLDGLDADFILATSEGGKDEGEKGGGEEHRRDSVWTLPM
jgi:hypothetical protein